MKNSLSTIIAEIKANVNIVDLFIKTGFDLTKKGKSYTCLCPFHSEKSPSFTVYPDTNTAYCFGCEWKGDLIDFYKEINNKDTVTVCKEIIDIFGLNIDMASPKSSSFRRTKRAKKETAKPKTLIPIPHCELAKIPEDQRWIDPIVEEKEITLTFKEKETGATLKLAHFYPYHAPDSETEVFKRKVELLEPITGKRIPFPDDGKEKHFDWFSRKKGTNKHNKGKGGYKGVCYRLHQSKENKGKIIMMCEGEKDVELLRYSGFVAISFDSSNFSELSEIECDGLIHFWDNDQAGDQKGEKLKNYCIDKQIPYLAIPILDIWSDAPEKADISDYATFINNPAQFPIILEEQIKQAWEKAKLIEKLNAKLQAPEQKEQKDKEESLKGQIRELRAKLDKGNITNQEAEGLIKEIVGLKIEKTTKKDEKDSKEELYTDVCLQELYSDGYYIFYNKDLYKFTGKHYEVQERTTEEKRIIEWLRAYNPQMSDGYFVDKIWVWLQKCLSVSHDKINPHGINLNNGILRIFWEDKKPIVKLLKHNPSDIYLYCSDVSYDESADHKDCDRLLSALEPHQQKILLRTLAVALDKPTYDKYQENARALVLFGNGGNGKDGIRTAIETLLGNGMVDVTLNEFQQYDQGKKENLQSLLGASIIWSSENTSLGKLENIGSIRSVITGQTIKIKYLYQDLIPYNPSVVCFFNCNDIPAFKSGLNAIKRRWAILRFNKTYKNNPNPLLGELPCDPRFLKDHDFVAKNVAPALLNKIIAELGDLLTKGINYDPVMEDFEAMQAESNHLFQFCQDTGIGYVEGGKVYIQELWEVLKQYYVETGTLEIELSDKGKERLTWYDQPKQGDKNVKGSNQIYKRFVELFPKVRRIQDTTNGGRWYLSGIGFLNKSTLIASGDSNPDEISISENKHPEATEATPEAETLTTKPTEATEANSPLNFSEAKKLSVADRIALVESLFSQEELANLGILGRRSGFAKSDLNGHEITHTSDTLTQPTTVVGNDNETSEHEKKVSELEPKFKEGDRVIFKGISATIEYRIALSSANWDDGWRYQLLLDQPHLGGKYRSALECDLTLETDSLVLNGKVQTS